MKMPTPLDGAHTYNLADVLAAIHGPTRGAAMLREFANEPSIRCTLTPEYYQACLNEADRLDMPCQN